MSSLLKTDSIDTFNPTSSVNILGLGFPQHKGVTMNHPPTTTGATQTNTAFYGGTGAPANGDGINGDFYFRSDGGALTTIYHKRGGAWVGIV